MKEAYICDMIRTPIGRFGGSLANIRIDDLAAIVLQEIIKRNSGLDPAAIEDVIMGCANQSGEDNRNVARMALLLAGLPTSVPGITVNRLCGSGLDAVFSAARLIKTGEAEIVIAGGVEGQTRAPFVISKAENAFSRQTEIYDTTMGWRFVNPKMKNQYGVDSMPQTAENVAKQFHISRAEQDNFAFRSQQKTALAIEQGRFKQEIISVELPQRKAPSIFFDQDEHPRKTNLEKMATLKPLFAEGTITAGNASGINDGSAALLIASERAIKQFDLTPIAHIIGAAVTGIEPAIMGMGPVEAVRKLCARYNQRLEKIDLIELNEAFAAQSLGVLQELGIDPEDERVNPNGGAIALGHPLGMSGARLVGTAALELQLKKQEKAIITMCVGVGQGIAGMIERV